MTALTFTLIADPSERLDLSALTPEKLQGKSSAEIEKLVIGLSKTKATVGDIFRLSGSDANSIIFEGGSARFDLVGHGMEAGQIRVTGDVGAKAGRKMSGGKLLIEGNADAHAGSGMTDGRIEISGNAGDFLGGPLAGELAGMNGGVLLVRGKAGNHAGDRLRRGLVAILGGAGDYLASRMVAGTIAVTGELGEKPGYLMRRGSILLDRKPTSILPSFAQCGSPDSVYAALADKHLIAEGILSKRLLGDRPHKIGGDNAVFGKGELLYPA